MGSSFSTIENINEFPENVKKISTSICKILFKNETCMGFLIKFFLKEEPFFCMITNNNNIDENMIDTNDKILILYNNDKQIRNINLNEKERYIKHFINTEILIIEILPKDNIEEIYFLLLDINFNNVINNPNELKTKEISLFGLQYKGYLSLSEGKIKKIENNEIIHPIKKGEKGSPIFFKDKMEVIGVNKGQKNSDNFGDLIFPIYIYFKEKIVKIYLNDDNDIYYIGEVNNNIPHGKGKYYFNNKEIYEGDVVNDKFEGKGKYIFENGEFYEGEFKNDMKYGKGILYDNEGYSIYEGDFVDDKYEGNGTLYFEGNNFYKGSFKNDCMYGKGILYYDKTLIQYEGDFSNNNFEGNGKYIWENGEYYIGEFKNNLNHGKGKLYYKNGEIKYEGDFVDDKFEGNGKYIYEDEDYYEGQFQNGLKHGKGILYYKNGNIQYEGDFVDGKFEGNGKYIYENGDYYEGQFKNGFCNGNGIEYDKDGNVLYEGNWIDDEFQNEN